MSQARAGAYAWYVAAIMMLTYAVQHIDRQIMSVVLEPVKREFGLADTQLGLLTVVVLGALAIVPFVLAARSIEVDLVAAEETG